MARKGRIADFVTALVFFGERDRNSFIMKGYLSICLNTNFQYFQR